MFAMDPTGVRRAAAGWSEPAASARTAAARLREAQVPRGEPDLSLGVELSAWLDVEADVAPSSTDDLAHDAADAQLVLTTPEWFTRVRAEAGTAHVAVVDRIMDLEAVTSVLEREL